MKLTLVPTATHARRAAGKQRDVVIRCRRNGVVDMYEKPETPNPNTPEQQLVRALRAEGTRNWNALPGELKRRWTAYGQTHGHRFVRESAEPLTGNRLYVSAAFFRSLLALSAPHNAPTLPPPPAFTRADLLPSSEPDTLPLRIEHPLAGSGHSVVVSMTPASGSPGRKGYRNHARYVKGVGSSSTASLPESGGEVVFTGCRFPIAPGERFGVWLRIIRHSDGLAGPELECDFVRPAAPPQVASSDLPQEPQISAIPA